MAGTSHKGTEVSQFKIVKIHSEHSFRTKNHHLKCTNAEKQERKIVCSRSQRSFIFSAAVAEWSLFPPAMREAGVQSLGGERHWSVSQ